MRVVTMYAFASNCEGGVALALDDISYFIVCVSLQECVINYRQICCGNMLCVRLQAREAAEG